MMPNHTPRTRKGLHGRRVEVPRSPEYWGYCLQSHVNDAHQGKVNPNCAACRELQERVNQR